MSIDKVALLRRLIRIDTTNPPGNEAAAVDEIRSVLNDAGLSTATYARVPERPNLVARVPGRGEAPPLLLHGHVDVVPVTGQRWDRDPFAGDLADGFVWGRGALDMKGPIVMMLDAVLRLAAEGPGAGDVLLCIVVDEEAHGTYGARFLVEDHATLFDGVRYCIGEFGGFPFILDGTRFYPIQVSERVGVGFEIRVEGPGGHGSLPIAGGAMAKAGRILTALDRGRLPVHLTAPTQEMLEGIAANTGGATRFAIRLLLDPRTAGPALRLLRSRLGRLEPVLRNTVSATVIRGGDKHNVIPSEVTIGLDGRKLPGVAPAEFEAELRRLVGDDCEIRTVHDEGGSPPAQPDMGLFDLLASALREADPDGVPVPFLLPAVTDGRWFARLGIQPYGFTPMSLPEDFDFQATVHGENERIPVDALDFGADALLSVLRRYAG